MNALLHDLLSSVRAILGGHFLGMYLHGSLALGDFDPLSSDVDFIAATHDELPSDLLPALKTMHTRLAALHPLWGVELEGSYIPRRALRRYDPPHTWHPRIQRGGTLQMEHHASDWVVQRHILCEHGVTLIGPHPHTLIDPVQPDDLRRAMVVLVREWWAPMCDDPALLRHRGYQTYAVLTTCRVLYTLQHGTVVSKPVAARWAQEALGPRWTDLIQSALAWQRHEQGDTDPHSLAATLDLIQYALERCR